MGFLLLLSLCGCFEPDPIVAVPPTATPEWPTPTAETQPTAAPKPEALVFPLAAPAHVGIQRPTDEGCVECHTDAEALRVSFERSSAAGSALPSYQAGTGEALPAETWESFVVNGDLFLGTVHGRYGCIGCHGGTGETALKEVAHQDMTADPSATGVCATCHDAEMATDGSSLHANLTGYQAVLFARTSPPEQARLETMMENHCATCHTTTCGQCHVSRPERLGGGLVAGHVFKDRQAINATCAGCHGTRIEDEYKGHHDTVPGDVHWTEARMACSDCHIAAEFHGTLEGFAHRYDGRPIPDCGSSGCHPDVEEDDGIRQHGDDHLKNLSCQACHAADYVNCYGCHVSMEGQQPQFELESSQIGLKLGRNPLQDRYRPWKYVPVRHVPIAPDSFAYYGENLLPNFDASPTWKYTTPHTIQRITPQNRECNACHGNAAVFLTVADVAAGELSANQRVVVEMVPEPVD